MRLTFEIEGVVEMDRRLRGIQAEMTDWRPAFSETAKYMQKVFANDVFETEGRAIGVRWTPLSRAYAERKAGKYPGKGILEATGTMRDSFETAYAANYAAIWNTAYYFKYHQSKRPRSKIPRRAMMKLGNTQKQVIQKKFHEEMIKKTRQ